MSHELNTLDERLAYAGRKEFIFEWTQFAVFFGGIACCFLVLGCLMENFDRHWSSPAFSWGAVASLLGAILSFLAAAKLSRPLKRYSALSYDLRLERNGKRTLVGQEEFLRSLDGYLQNLGLDSFSSVVLATELTKQVLEEASLELKRLEGEGRG